MAMKFLFHCKSRKLTLALTMTPAQVSTCRSGQTV